MSDRRANNIPKKNIKVTTQQKITGTHFINLSICNYGDIKGKPPPAAESGYFLLHRRRLLLSAAQRHDTRYLLRFN